MLIVLDEIDAGPKHRAGGAHRTRAAAETLSRIEPMKGRFGITRIANVTGLDRIGIPVVLVTRPNSRSVAVSQGKGLSLEAAKVSALMEAIELWHAENSLRRMFFDSHGALAKHLRTLDAERLPRVAGSRYTPDLRMHWIDGTDLMSGEPVLVPYELVHANYTIPRPPGDGCFPATTNGLASGNHPIEAICQGICEVIERDAITLWHHQPAETRAGTRIDPSTIDAGTGSKLLSAIASAGLEVALWDATSDIGVATLQCLISDPEGGHIGLGSGAHPERSEALTRAIAEAAQTRLNYITGARDDLSSGEFRLTGRQQKERAARAMRGLGRPARDFMAVPSHTTETLREDLDWLLARLAAAGVAEVAAVELTQGTPGFFVFRIVVPGLEPPHDDEAYLPGPRAKAAEVAA